MEDSRLDKLEKELAELKSRLCDEPKKKSSKEKKDRKPSAYNDFMKKYIAEQKTELGDKYDHKAVFKSAAEAWSQQKKSA